MTPRPWLRRHRRARRAGSVAVEFALIAVTFLGMLMFTAQLGFRLYAQLAIDYATVRAARLLAVDSPHTLSASRSTFQSATFCPLLAAMLQCSNVLITLRPVATDYLSDSQSNPPVLTRTLVTPATFSAGQSTTLMLLQVIDLGPAMTWPRSDVGAATYNGTSGSALVSSAPYINEY